MCDEQEAECCSLNIADLGHEKEQNCPLRPKF